MSLSNTKQFEKKKLDKFLIQFKQRPCSQTDRKRCTPLSNVIHQLQSSDLCCYALGVNVLCRLMSLGPCNSLTSLLLHLLPLSLTKRWLQLRTNCDRITTFQLHLESAVHSIQQNTINRKNTFFTKKFFSAANIHLVPVSIKDIARFVPL